MYFRSSSSRNDECRCCKCRQIVCYFNALFFCFSSKDMEIDFLDAIDTKPDYSWLDAAPAHPHLMPLQSTLSKN